jgi:RNA polymerase sigma-54 factor
LDPVGTCTANYEESLYVQMSLLPDAARFGECGTAALSQLALLHKGKFADAAKKLGCSPEEAQEIFECIKGLNPFPGRQFASSNTRFIVPDVQVIRKADDLEEDGSEENSSKIGFSIILNDEEIPVLGLNPFFMKIVKEKGDKNSRDFARENLKEARWFIRSINERNHTLLRVTRAIVEIQRAFFEKGPGHLVPLTQRDIALELDVHESTVSRIANGKYIQTEWGVFGIKYFFTNAISKNPSTSQLSKEGVKEIIRQLISDEKTHLSDQEIAGLLANRGIPLARRTVAKYRKELDMGSSYNR